MAAGRRSDTALSASPSAGVTPPGPVTSPTAPLTAGVADGLDEGEAVGDAAAGDGLGLAETATVAADVGVGVGVTLTVGLAVAGVVGLGVGAGVGLGVAWVEEHAETTSAETNTARLRPLMAGTVWGRRTRNTTGFAGWVDLPV